MLRHIETMASSRSRMGMVADRTQYANLSMMTGNAPPSGLFSGGGSLWRAWFRAACTPSGAHPVDGGDGPDMVLLGVEGLLASTSRRLSSRAASAACSVRITSTRRRSCRPAPRRCGPAVRSPRSTTYSRRSQQQLHVNLFCTRTDPADKNSGDAAYQNRRELHINLDTKEHTQAQCRQRVYINSFDSTSSYESR